MKQQLYIFVYPSGENLSFKLLCSNPEELRFFVKLMCKRFSVPIDHTVLYLGRLHEQYPFGTYEAVLTRNEFYLTLHRFLRRSTLERFGIRIEGQGFVDSFLAPHLGGDFLIEVLAAATQRDWELFQWDNFSVLLVK
jgi:hypothetical protein